MPQVKGKEAKYNPHVKDSMTGEPSTTIARKKGLQDKMNRAPEFNKGIAKRNKNPSIEI